MPRIVRSYKYLLLILSLSLAISLVRGQGSNGPVIINDSVMMIGPDVESLTEEQIYFNPTYLVVDPTKGHLRDQLIRACVCDCDTSVPNRRIGVFSVAKERQVSFSQGSLQYLPVANLWKFASQQYEYLHNSNKYLSPSYRNWVDLFSWSGEGSNAPFGVSTSTNQADFAGEFLDWGINPICGDTPSVWRTLSKDEWIYLIEKRKDADQLYGVASVNGINGLVILPDADIWVCPEGITFNSGVAAKDGSQHFQTVNNFTLEQWTRLENAGAVFLTACGVRFGNTYRSDGQAASYWTSTRISDTHSYLLNFHSNIIRIQNTSGDRQNGRSVRLVHDTIVPPPAPCDTFEVNGVIFHMMCVEGGTFMMGSDDSSAPSNTRPAHPVTLSDYQIGQTEVTRGLWRAVMGSVVGSGDDNLPVGHVTWEECQVFLRRLGEMTGQPFRLPTEAEWEYAARGGQKSKDFVFSGSDSANIVGWINNESKSKMPVAQKRHNELGIYDMTGNSWEWCQDGGLRLYTRDSVVNPIYTGASSGHVIRGGSFRTVPERCTNIARSTYGQNATDTHISLRIVKDTIFPSPTPSKRIGVFSVAKDKQVSFSQGNLQYLKYKDCWQFAENQWEYMGDDNAKDGALSYKIDLFGWSSDSGKAPFGISTSQTAADYMGQFVDWGVNEIQGDAANTWRTLSQEEWNYIFENRKNAKQLYSKGSIDGVRGMIVLPDDWVQPQGLHFTADPTNLDMDLDINVYTAEQWQKMEEAGAVFLCPTGRRDGTEIGHTVWYGGYWSSSRSGEHVKHMYFNYNSEIFTTNYSSGDYSYGYNGRAVRLVHDTIVPPPAPCETFEVKGVTFNMMCVEGGTFMMGATDDDTLAQDDERPQHQVTVSDFMIGQTEVTQELWTAVMGSNPSKNKGTLLPVEQVNWEDCEIFITRLNQLTGRNFRLPTEAEWEYAARGGQKSRGFIYAGSDDLNEVAWYDGNSSNKTHNVGTKYPNELGVYDMSGNVYERCYDWYAPYTAEAQVNPKGPTSAQTYRTVRGGGAEQNVYGNSIVCRVLNRGFSTPESRESYIGLRLVLDEHEYVDLGLSVMWATTNVGAESAEEYGEYFAWGETEPKTEYTWANYKWCDGTENNMTKYNATDGLKTLQLEDDAAHVNWGGEWRMPSEAEWSELREYCEWEWITQSGVDGYKITSKIINGNSIFIAAGGYYSGTSHFNLGKKGQLWTSTAVSTKNARAFRFGSDELPKPVVDYRRCGENIRPVIPTYREILTPATHGKCIGVFSVAKDKQVSFSQGNLQYSQSTDEWGFAEKQYDYLGADNVTDGALADKIDLFGWSTDNAATPWGMLLSINNQLFVGSFMDWGMNAIQGDTANTWRTLSYPEWKYLFKGRSNASQLYAFAMVDTINGVIVLPDDWQPIDGVSLTMGDNPYAKNPLTMEQWAKLEAANAVFLPAAGVLMGATHRHTTSGLYWSSTADASNETYAHSLYFPSTYIYIDYTHQRSTHRSVRLVQDTIVPPPAPCETFKVNGVTFNMMCVEGGTFMMGEGRSDAHQVTLSDYYIGETEVTQGLWKAVMGSIPDGQEYEGDEYPVAFVSLADCRVFVERLSQMTGKFFRIPTEAEWEYAARGGKHSKGYTYAGSDSIDEVAWYKDNMTDYQPHAVKQLKPNELGTYDMTGNLAEWVSDWYAPYNKYPQTNPTGAAEPAELGYRNNYRGGGWTFTKDKCDSTFRHRFTNRGANGIGFRLAMSDEEPFRAVYLNDTIRFYLRPVKKGTFMMGSRDDDPIVNQNLAAKADELPQHKVILDSDYWVAEYELTQALWTAVMGTDIYDMQAALTKPSSGPVPAGPSYPMYFVYTKDVLEFTRRLSQLTGLNFRLPTEAEWEFAARGGNLTHGYLYAGSNNVDSVAWYTGSNSGIQIVGQKMPNELGIYDLSGNVLERCIDYLEYHQSYNPNDSINPRGRLLQSGNRAYRGGAHNMHKDSVRVTHRAPQTPTFTSQNVGTRLVVNDEHHFQTFNVGSVWFDMIFVKGGTFQMGATEEQGSEAAAHEFPVHEVTLSDYYIGQIEVTQRLWQTVMGSSNNPSTIKDSNKPVNNVTWEECQVFVEKLSQMTGYYFRLPTEAEWEFAARGGNKSKGYKYAGSDNLSDVAWYSGNSGGTTHTFATKQPNELGIYDMSGNVWEWCYDWYGPYSAEAQVDPTGPETGEYHMYRGGGWTYVENDCRVTRRRQTESYNKEFLGLRLAMNQDAMIPLPEPDPIPGRRIGVFSVAKDKQVSFSQGNLQYTQSKNQWRFAENQYDYLGEENVKDGQLANRIDLFGWSGKDSNAPWGISNSTNTADYAGEFVDWGANVIGGDVANTWRTLSKEEWDYIVKGRRNAEQLHSKCCINNVKGFLLLPDNWVSIEGISIEKVVDADTLPSDVNVFTLEQWKQMEAAGAVFLPAAGANIQPTIKHTNRFGGYCSSTKKDVNNSYILAFHVGPTSYTEYSNNKYGRSVRLVRDTIVPEYVDLGLSVLWATTNVGANEPEEYGDYFAWGETEPKDSYTSANYKWNDNTKYNSNGGLTSIQLEDDAANANWGGEWRMPTKEEYSELIEQCIWTWTQHNGINGYQVTGPNGNSIFLPATGYKGNGPSYPAGEYGLYWPQNELHATSNSFANLFILGAGNKPSLGQAGTRYFGFSVRPVRPVEPMPKPGRRIGVVSVAKDKQVSFSQGLLQYIQSEDQWQFAPDQFYFTGNRHYQNGELADTIMYFGWSGKGSKAPWGISLSIDSDDYEGEFVDWGTNIIGGDTANTWRTTSDEEWNYMLRDRKNADKLRGIARVDTINGLILLPDDWILPEGMHFEPTIEMVESNQYTLSEWSVMENAGAVFMPMSGYFNHKLDNMRKVNVDGYARHNALRDGRQVYSLFKTGKLVFSYQGNNTSNLFYAFPVRLVRDTVVPEYVDMGLSVKWANYNLGASTPAGVGDYYAWGETEPKTEYTWANYKWSNGSTIALTKYCTVDTMGNDGFTDGLTTLLPEDDAVQVHKGGNWRMPSSEEWEELRKNCTWTQTELNGQTGFIAQSKINGNRIFIPVTGFRSGKNLVLEYIGGYWSSSLNTGRQSCAFGMYLNLNENRVGKYSNSNRQDGFLIRPVLSE